MEDDIRDGDPASARSWAVTAVSAVVGGLVLGAGALGAFLALHGPLPWLYALAAVGALVVIVTRKAPAAHTPLRRAVAVGALVCLGALAAYAAALGGFLLLWYGG